MEDKIYMPYIISNNMILQYEDKTDQQYSIKEILIHQN